MLSVVLVSLDHVSSHATSLRNMLSEHRTYKWKTTVAADGNFGLVGVDKDLGMPSRTFTSLTSHNPIMGPPYRLLVHHLHRALRLRLLNGSAILPFLPVSSLSYLKIEIRLLKPGTRHRLRPRLLVARPYADSVRRLVDLCGLILVHWGR